LLFNPQTRRHEASGKVGMEATPISRFVINFSFGSGTNFAIAIDQSSMWSLKAIDYRRKENSSLFGELLIAHAAKSPSSYLLAKHGSALGIPNNVFQGDEALFKAPSLHSLIATCQNRPRKDESRPPDRVIGSYCCHRRQRTRHYSPHSRDYLYTSRRSLSRYARAKRERSLGN